MQIASGEVTQESIALVLAESLKAKRQRAFTIEVFNSTTGKTNIVENVSYNNILLLEEK